jgi:hypothetical protein
MSNKQITLTFTQSYGKFGGCFDMCIERDENVSVSHIVQFDRLKPASQLRFLTWAMSQKWTFEHSQLPNWHRDEYDDFYEFTLSPDGQDTESLRYYFDYVA